MSYVNYTKYENIDFFMGLSGLLRRPALFGKSAGLLAMTEKKSILKVIYLRTDPVLNNFLYNCKYFFAETFQEKSCFMALIIN